MLIVTDFWASFPKRWLASSGFRGRSVAEVRTLEECLKYCARPDTVFVINAAQNPGLALRLAAEFTIRPKLRRPLVAVDIVLRVPRRPIEYAMLPVKRFLLSRIDHHILFFKDLSGYRKWFGVGPKNSSYVPFKVNIPFPTARTATLTAITWCALAARNAIGQRSLRRCEPCRIPAACRAHRCRRMFWTT